MYLYIFEDGGYIQKTNAPSDDDKLSCEDGYLSVIKFEDGKFLTWYGCAWKIIDNHV